MPIDANGRALFLERFIHGEIYKARPDVMAVVHTHSPGVIPFTVSQVPLRPLFHNAAFLAAGAPVWEIRKDFGETDMLVRDAARGKSLAAYAWRQIGGADARPRRRHGRAIGQGGGVPRLLYRRRRQGCRRKPSRWEATSII